MEDDLFDKLNAYPCAMVVESNLGIDKVIEDAKRLSKPGEVLIAIRQKDGIEKRILPAYINAYLRYKEDSMHAGSLSLETILFIAGRMNIGNAVEEVSANKSRFILFSSSRQLAQLLIKKSKLRKIKELTLLLDANVASDVAMTAIKDDK